MKAQHFAGAGTPRGFLIHENDAWVEPLRRELAILGAPFSEWFLDEGMLHLAMTPPEGIFWRARARRRLRSGAPATRRTLVSARATLRRRRNNPRRGAVSHAGCAALCKRVWRFPGAHVAHGVERIPPHLQRG
jgi:hypothetical protein